MGDTGIPGLAWKRGPDREELMLDKQLDAQKEIAQIETATNPGDEQIYAAQEGGRSDLLRWQQELDDEWVKLANRLRNLEELSDGTWIHKTVTKTQRDPQTNKPKINPVTKKPIQVKEILPPLCNELFITKLESQVKPFLSRNMLNSNFNEGRILMMLKNTMNDIASNMADCWDQYDIEFEDYDMITRLIKTTIAPAPFRALNDGERRHARTISKRVETFAESGKINKNKTISEGVFGPRQ